MNLLFSRQKAILLQTPKKGVSMCTVIFNFCYALSLKIAKKRHISSDPRKCTYFLYFFFAFSLSSRYYVYGGIISHPPFIDNDTYCVQRFLLLDILMTPGPLSSQEGEKRKIESEREREREKERYSLMFFFL